MAQPVRIAVIGHSFMGKVHTQAWDVARRLPDIPSIPEVRVLVGRDFNGVRAHAERWGIAEASSDWREVVNRDDIDVVDICSPGVTHPEIAIAALEAGKHVICEKPLANSLDDARSMTKAAAKASEGGAVAFCGFSYRRTPALALAREFVLEGKLGEIRHVRAQYLQDWLSDEDAPMTWRLDKSIAGSGALGDIGSHIIDSAQWVTGQDIARVSAMLHTFVHSRPTSGAKHGLGGSGDPHSERETVTVDDAAAFTAQFTDGAIGVFEATRFALGRRNANRIEINGSLGSVAFDFERMNELEYFDGRDENAEQGFRVIQVSGEGFPYTSQWWPPGHGIGYAELFVHQFSDVLKAIAAGSAVRPDFADACQVQSVLDAVERSSDSQSILTAVNAV